ncbi:CLUMA_CG012054, isoform A, partial [Clunio marinus]
MKYPVACNVMFTINIKLTFRILFSHPFFRHKRKVQNFLPCKTPTRGPLDPSVLPVGHSVTYEDPDIHMGHHRPLVMRQHPLNVEMLHAKALHYPSGFPMPRSPPLFICSSPGPDPYRSNDNVYEELEHRGRFSDCDRQLHSDEDFAEDELSLPGDRSLNKSSSENTTVATIYQDRGGVGSSSNKTNENAPIYLERNRVERNSLLSSASSSANDNNMARPNVRNSSSSTESNHHSTLNRVNNNVTNSNPATNTGFFRFRTSRPNTCKAKNSRQKSNNFSMDNLNSSTETTPADEVPSYVSGSGNNSSGNNNTGSSSASNNNNTNSDPISLSAVNGSHIEGDTNNNSNICGRNNYYGAESEVERRNRINAQLSNPTLNVATIFRDRNIPYHPPRANANYYAPPQHMMLANRANHSNNNNIDVNGRSRTNPRIDRRRHVNREQQHGNCNVNSNSSSTINNNNSNQEYLYHEPVYHEDVLYDPYSNGGGGRNQIYHQPYILPEFTTFRNFNNLNNPHQPLYNSAMGSDSGYSQNTQMSGRSLWGHRKRVNNTNNNNNNSSTLTTPSASNRNE